MSAPNLAQIELVDVTDTKDKNNNYSIHIEKVDEKDPGTIYNLIIADREDKKDGGK